MYTFSELQTQVKRGAVRGKGGTDFDASAKDAINRALYRLSREAQWRSLRKSSSFNTITSYTEGSGAVAVTEDSADITVTGATFITDGVTIGRRIDISGSNKKFRISSITGETTLTLDQTYDGDTATDATYSIYPQQTYNLPIQSDHQVILWHEQYGCPTPLSYITSQESFGRGYYEDLTGIPTYYRMWEQDDVITQLRQASTISVVSSSASDTTQSVTVFGIVSGYPDYETINLNGTTTATGSKSFTKIERVVGSSTARTGRVTVSGNSGEDVIAVLPVGNTTREIQYAKVSIGPLPTSVFPIYVYYYKTPYMLVGDNDVHELGGAFDNAIIYLAIAIMRGEGSQKEATTYLAMYKDELKVLKKHYIDKIDWRPRLQPGNITNRFGAKAHANLYYGQIGNGGWFGPTVN